MPKRDQDIPYSKASVPVSLRLRTALDVATEGGKAHVDQMVRCLAVQLGFELPISVPTHLYLEGLLVEVEDLLTSGHCPGVTEGYYEQAIRWGLLDPDLDGHVAFLHDLHVADKPLPSPVIPEDLYEALGDAIKRELTMRLIRAAGRWKADGIFELTAQPGKSVWRSARQKTA